MFRPMSLEDAASYFWAGSTGKIKLKSGAVVGGDFLEYEDESDDPDGLGYIAMFQGNDRFGGPYAKDVRADEIAGIVE